MSSSRSSSSGWSASRFICRCRPFLRLLLLVTFVVLAASYSFRALTASALLRHSENLEETLWRLRAAHKLFPWDHVIRGAEARFYTIYRRYDRRTQAIEALETELRADPFAADLWTALAAYKFAADDEAGAKDAVEHIKRLRPGVTLEKE